MDSRHLDIPRRLQGKVQDACHWVAASGGIGGKESLPEVHLTHGLHFSDEGLDASLSTGCLPAITITSNMPIAQMRWLRLREMK